MDKVPENVQETIFNQILNRAENRTCADCNAKSPNWCSIDFGVFICLQCAGAHRNLGPNITRVRSAKLDAWQMSNINILAAIGNKIANNYWENNMPKHVKKLDLGSSMDEIQRFVNEKYIKKAYISPAVRHPVQEYLNMLKSQDITPGEFYQGYIKRMDGGLSSLSIEKSKSSSYDQNITDTFKFLSAKPFSSTSQAANKTRDEFKFNSFDKPLKPSNNLDSKSLFDSFSSAPYEKSGQSKSKEVNIFEGFNIKQEGVKHPETQQPSKDSFFFESNSNDAANFNSFNQVKGSNFSSQENKSQPTQQQQQQFQNSCQFQNTSNMQSLNILDLYKTPVNQGPNTQGVNNGNQNFKGAQSNYAALDPWSQNSQFGANGNSFGMPNYQSNQQQQVQQQSAYYSNNFGSNNGQYGNMNPYGGGFTSTNNAQKNINDNKGFNFNTTSTSTPQTANTFESNQSTFSSNQSSGGGSNNSGNPFLSFGIGDPVSNSQNTGFNSFPAQNNTNPVGNSTNPWAGNFNSTTQNNKMGSPFF